MLVFKIKIGRLELKIPFYALFINGKMRLPFIDSDLLYTGAL
jgi:hypothetical protein